MFISQSVQCRVKTLRIVLWIQVALALVIFSLRSPKASADFLIHAWDDHHAADSEFKLGGYGGVYSTNTNFDQAGLTYSPAGLVNYSRFFGDIDANYGLSTHWSVYGRVSWASAQLNTGTTPGTSFGLTDQTVGINFRLVGSNEGPKVSFPWINIQAQIDFSAYNNNSNLQNNLPSLGDNTQDFTLGAFATLPIIQKPYGELLASVGGGATARSAGFSAALPYLLEVSYLPTTGGLVGSLGFVGIYSLNTETSGTPTAGQGAGGSFAVDSPNPSLVQLRVRGGYEFSRNIRVLATFQQALAGQNSSSGYLISGGVQFSLYSKMEDRTNPLKIPPNVYGKSNRGFINYGFEAKVTAGNDRLNLIKIDKGSQDGVEPGMIYDIFSTRTDGSIIESIARAKVTDVKPSESALKITEYFKEVWINAGFIAKRPLE